MQRDAIDMHSVPEHQRYIHERLVNWARWVEVRPHYAISPMFKIMGYRSNSRQWHAPELPPRPADGLARTKARVGHPKNG